MPQKESKHVALK